MPKSITELLRTTDPSFLKEYQGKLLQYGGKFYEIKGGRLQESLVDPRTMFTTGGYSPSQIADVSEASGLAPAGSKRSIFSKKDIFLNNISEI